MKQGAMLVLGITLGGCASAGSTPTSGSAEPTVTVVTTNTASGTMARTMAATRDTRGTEFVLTVDREVAFAALEHVFDDLNLPVTVRNPATGTIGNPDAVLTRRVLGAGVSRFLSCGVGPFGDPIADVYRVVGSVMATVDAADDRSRLSVRVSARASNRGVGGAPVDCASTGELEKRVHALLQRRLAESMLSGASRP